MSKLLTKPNQGYTKASEQTGGGTYPNTLVEAVYWDKEGKSLEEALLGSTETAIPVDGFAPNMVYNLGTITDNTTFLMAEGEDGKTNHYFWTFETGSIAPTITWPSNIRLWI